MLPSRRIPAALTIFTLLLLLAISLNLSAYLRGPEEWRWPYAIPGQPLRLLIPIAVLTFYVSVILRWTNRLLTGPFSHGTTWRFLLFVCLMTPLIQLALMTVNSPDVVQQLFFRTIPAEASGVFSVGTAITDTRTFLADYPSLMPGFPVHPQRYPPGLPLLFHWKEQVLHRSPALSDLIGDYLRLYQCQDFDLMRLSNAAIASATLQMSLPLASGLIAFPLYYLGRCLRNHQTALWSVAFYPLVPSLVLWAGVWDQFYPLLAVITWLFLCIGLRRSQARWIFLGGLTLGVASLFSFGLLALLVPLGLWAIAWSLLTKTGRIQQWNWSKHLIHASLFLASVATPWLLYQAFFGIGFREIWQVSMSFHMGIRNYWTWLFYHLYDFGLFLGIPLFVLMILSVVEGLRQRHAIGKHLLPLAFGIGLLLLDLSGTSQGEVARVWIFLTPFAILAAAHHLANKPAWLRRAPLVALLLALQLLTFTAFLRVFTTGVPDPRPYERTFALSEQYTPLDAQFDGGVRLGGYDLDVAPAPSEGSEIALTLYWEALAPIHRPYSVFRHLLDESGEMVAQQDNMPQQDQWPTTCWIPGEIVADTAVMPLSNELSPGTYRLVTGMYWLETGERLAVSGANALPGEQVMVQEITLPRVDP